MSKAKSNAAYIPPSSAKKKTSGWKYFLSKKNFYFMLIPCILYFLIFSYIPMYGVLIAFKDFNFKLGIWGSDWIGFENFRYMFGLNDFYEVFRNSITLSVLRLIFTFPFPILLALFMNDIEIAAYQKTVQTVIYLPHFLSWVVIGGILINFLSPTNGVVNKVIEALGGEPIFFLAEPEWFRPLIVLTSIWQGSGWGTIVYLAAITSIPTELYEASTIDGATRLQKLWYITLPSIKATVVTMLVLSMGRIMGNGFEQIYILQNPMNLEVSDVFETYTYRIGMLGGRYSFATSVGLFTSVISVIFILTSNKIANMLGEEGIW